MSQLRLKFGRRASWTPPVEPELIITSDASASAEEGNALSGVLTASEPVTWSIEGGASAADFALVGNSWTLTATSPGTYFVTWKARAADGRTRVQAFVAIITAAGAEIALLAPGATAFGSWAAGSWPALPTGKQGTPGVGYDCRAKGAWMNPINMTVRGGQYIVGVQAYQQIRYGDYRNADGLVTPYNGVKEVRFSVDNGPVTTVTKPSINPETGLEGYLVRLDSSAWASAKRCEIRAEVVPWHGDPFVLEGFPTTHLPGGPATPGGYHRINTTHDMWSLPINIDPTGSSLPGAVVWKAPAGSALGSDSNDGLTRATPLKTWRATINRVKALHGTDDVGGATVYLLHDPAVNHEFGVSDYTGTAGIPAVTDIVKAATQWFHIKSDPTVARGAVVVDSATPFGLTCEKLWIEFKATATIVNKGSTSNVLSLSYFDLCFHKFDFDGGPAVDPLRGLPEGPPPAVLANGYSYVIDSTIDRVKAVNFFEIVHVERTAISNVGQYSDVFWNPKVIDAITVSNVTDLKDNEPGDTDKHVDVLQLVNQRRMMVWRDFVALDEIKSQLLYGDRPSRPEQIALVRPRLRSLNGFYTYGLIGSQGLKDHFVFDPEITGTMLLFSEPPRGVAVVNTNPQSEDFGMVSEVRESFGVQYVYLQASDKASGIASYFNPWLPGRYGQTYLAPWTDQELVEGQPATSAIQTFLTDETAPGVFDMQLPARWDREWSASANAWEVVGWRSNSTSGWYPEMARDPKTRDPQGQVLIPSSTAFYKNANAKAPLYKEDALWGAVLEFDGVNTGPASGMGLTSGNAGWPLRYRSGANAEADILLAFSQDDVATQATTRTLFACGGTANSGYTSLDVRRTVSSGRQHIYVGCGIADETAPITGVGRVVLSTSTLAGTPDISGRVRLRIQKLTDRLKVTIWSAQYPDGATQEIAYGAGKLAVVDGGRMNIGGTTVNASGTNGGWPKMKLGALYFVDALHSNAALEQNVIDAFAAAFPLSAP